MKTISGLTALALLAMTAAPVLAGPEIVAGPGADPECFKPWSAETKYMQWPAKEGPYRIAVVNGFVGNTLADPDDQDRQGLSPRTRRLRTRSRNSR